MKKLILLIAGGLLLTLLALALSACGSKATASSSPAATASSSPATAAAMVTTLAGKAGVKGSTDGTGAAARFDVPQAIAFDAAGNLYVADYFAVRKVTPAGVVTTIAGKGGVKGSANGSGSAARFDNLCGIVRNAAGDLYVTDCHNNTIRKITPAGVVSTFAGKAGVAGSANGSLTTARFDYPVGIAINAAGDIYISDWGANTIRKITPAGQVTTLAGKAGKSGFADGTGAAARFDNPAGICLDAAGDLYVADNGNDTIRKITPAGVVTTVAGSLGLSGDSDGTGNAASFSSPGGICCDAAGDLYVADTGNYTIRKITPAGMVTTVAGAPGYKGSSDGNGLTTASFYYPWGIAVDAAGDLYVADTGNNLIRKITFTK